MRVGVRLLYLVGLVLILITLSDNLRQDHGRLLPSHSPVAAFAGLWFLSALLGYVLIKAVHGAEWLWHRYKRPVAGVTHPVVSAGIRHASLQDFVPDPSRRTFFRTASVVAGAAPFLGVMYGFAAERLRYEVRRIEIPLTNLPPELDGMQIVQISDIHLSAYMNRDSVRRAVDMANDIGADLAVVTGDLITGIHDSMFDCVDEVRQLRAPLGVYGCNGNHEIYARAEDMAERLYQQAGMKLLRRENAVISYNVGEFLTGDPKEQVVFTNSTYTGPTGIAFDDSGNVYVSDLYSGSMAKYNSSGVFQFAVNSGYATGVAWDKTNGCVYVTDAITNKINVFTSTGGACSPSTLF